MTAFEARWLVAIAVLAFVGALTAGAPPALLVALSIGFAIVVGAYLLLTRRRAVRRWLHTVPPPTEEQIDAVVHALANSNPGFVPLVPRPEVPRATDEQLCREWCESYRALQDTASRRKFLRIVEQRRRHLDEMERRNPAAFAVWLASGATASDNPLPYLRQTNVDRTAIDWDELTGGQDQ